jgi:glutathione S-transferase
MKLLGSFTSPFVRKVRVQLLEKAVPFEFVSEDVWSADTSIQTLNPLGKVPSLVLNNGTVVYDSAVITETIEALFSSNPLIPSDAHERCDVRVLEAVGDGISEAAVSMLLEARFHEGEKMSQPWIDRQIGKLMVSTAMVEKRLQASGSGFVRKEFSLADISIGSGLLYTEFRFPQVPWRAEYPEVSAYIDRLLARESFAKTEPPR